MLWGELSSSNWNGFVVLRCLGSFWWHAYCQFLEISEFWTTSDWTEFGLVRPSLSSFDVSCHEFCTFFIFAAWHVYGFHTRGDHCDLFCSHVKSCAYIGSWIWVSFCMLPQVCIISFCLRHRSVNDHALPVKMCGTHLGVIVSVIFIGSVNHLLRGYSMQSSDDPFIWTKQKNFCSDKN